MLAVVGEVIIGLALGAVLVFSAAPKLRDPRSFTLTVLEYRVLPPRAARAFARLLPKVEIICGLLLLTGVADVLAGALAAVIFSSFIIGVGVNVFRGRDLDCGCFGSGNGRTVGWPLLAEDVGLLAAAVAYIRLASTHSFTVTGPVLGTISLTPILMVAVIACCAAAGGLAVLVKARKGKLESEVERGRKRWNRWEQVRWWSTSR